MTGIANLDKLTQIELFGMLCTFFKHITYSNANISLILPNALIVVEKNENSWYFVYTCKSRFVNLTFDYTMLNVSHYLNQIDTKFAEFVESVLKANKLVENANKN